MAARVHRFGKDNQLTLNTILQGAWALLLAHYSGESDVVFGATVSGRAAAIDRVEDLVGLFINTLPMRARIHDNATTAAWLGLLQALQSESREYEYTPLASVHAWSDVPRGRPIFDSIFVFENYPLGAALDRRTEPYTSATPSSVEQTNYPLTIVVDPSLTFRFIFDADRFDAPTIARAFRSLSSPPHSHGFA